MSGGLAVTGQKRLPFFARRVALTAWGAAPDIEKWAHQPKRSEGHSPAPRPLKGQPQERQHSAAAGGDAGPTVPGEGYIILARAIVTKWPRPAIPLAGSSGLGEHSE